MPIASIIVPAFNVAGTIGETLSSLLAQSCPDFEIVIVNDGSTDQTLAVVAPFLKDQRVRVIQQLNRGLAGARNSGIAAARGAFIGFCDADDIWEPQKLETHIAHFERAPEVGISYAGSALIDDNGDFLRTAQRPRLYDVTAAHILKRNPIGNGSAPVMRREVFEQIAYRPRHESERDWYYDETLRQSEDLECALRIALTTDWAFEGVPGLLTRYRISGGALSANTDRQLDTWERAIAKLTPLAPDLFAAHAPAARAYQLRYLARRAIHDLDPARARHLLAQSLRASLRPLHEEPGKSVLTFGAALALHLGGGLLLTLLQKSKGAQHA